MAVKLAIHQQNVVSAVIGGLYISVLCHGVVGVDIYHVAVFVGLRTLYQGAVFLEGIEFVFRVLEESELHCGITELLVGKHTVFDEDLYVVPFLFKVRTVCAENIFQTGSYFLGDVA